MRRRARTSFASLGRAAMRGLAMTALAAAPPAFAEPSTAWRDSVFAASEAAMNGDAALSARLDQTARSQFSVDATREEIAFFHCQLGVTRTLRGDEVSALSAYQEGLATLGGGRTKALSDDVCLLKGVGDILFGRDDLLGAAQYLSQAARRMLAGDQPDGVQKMTLILSLITLSAMTSDGSLAQLARDLSHSDQPPPSMAELDALTTQLGAESFKQMDESLAQIEDLVGAMKAEHDDPATSEARRAELRQDIEGAIYQSGQLRLEFGTVLAQGKQDERALTELKRAFEILAPYRQPDTIVTLTARMEFLRIAMAQTNTRLQVEAETMASLAFEQYAARTIGAGEFSKTSTANDLAEQLVAGAWRMAN